MRWQDQNGNWIPTPVEAERQRTDIERQRADTERQRAERLEARLRELGIDPNEISE
ncbi:MAG: hypothetical protein RI580_09150 [Halothece sp. Uz-M2-17]|nr:hypothetical protein [Halothece sp. Uz-M2-17]